MRPLGAYLVELGYVTEEQIEQPFREQKSGMHPGLRMGDMLQHKNIITRAQLDGAIELQMLDKYA